MKGSKLWDLVLARKWLAIFAKVFIFTLTMVWILGLILIGLLFYHYLLIPMVGLAGITGLILGFILAWYIFTLLIVSVLVASWGLKFVGKWERESKEYR